MDILKRKARFSFTQQSKVATLVATAWVGRRAKKFSYEHTTDVVVHLPVYKNKS